MNRLLFILFLIPFSAGAQSVNFEELAAETSEYLDDAGYHKPDFQWNMEGRVQAALNDGINYLDEGLPGEALPQLEEAIRLAPNLWVSHYYKGVAHKQLKQYREAEQAFHHVNALNDKNIWNYIELGKTYGLQKEYSKGERYFERAAKIDETNAAPVYLLANNCLKQGQLERAKRLYKESMKIDERMLDSGVKLALIDAATRKNPKHAMKYLEEVLAKDSLHKQALLFHGIIKAKDDIHASLKDWDKLVRLNPTNVMFRLMRGVLLSQTRQYDKGFSDLRKVVDAAQVSINDFSGQQTTKDKTIDIQFAGFYVVSNIYGLPDEDAALIRKAYCLMFLDDFDNAVRAIEGVKGWNNIPLCLFLKAVANEHRGQHNKAFHLYDSALLKDNDIFDAHKKRGIYFTELKQWEAAEADFNVMLKLNPEAYVTYKLRGLARYHNSRYADATADFSRYLEKDSTNKEVLGFRGMAYQHLHDFLPSTLDFLKSGNGHAVEPWEKLVLELDKMLARKDTAKVLSWLEQATTAEKRYLPAHMKKVRLLVSLNRWADVGRSADKAMYRNDTEVGTAVNLGYTNQEHSFLSAAKAMSLVEDGNPERAIRELELAITLDRNNSFAYRTRAEAHLKLNNKQGAIKDFEKAVILGDRWAPERLKGLK